MQNKLLDTLMVEVMNLFSDKFNQQAILKGGMVLKLLGSLRSTNDLDYVFIPYTSKKDVSKKILDVLSEMPEVELSHSMNSKCLRIIVKRETVSLQIEINVSPTCLTEVAGNTEMAHAVNLPPRLITIMDTRVSMAHKMAAWNERRLLRDIHDVYFFIKLGTKPDMEILKKRLQKPNYSEKIPEDEKLLPGANPDDLLNALQNTVSSLSDKILHSELSDYLEPLSLAGLHLKLKNVILNFSY